MKQWRKPRIRSVAPLVTGQRVDITAGDFKGSTGVVGEVSEHGWCGVIKLDSGIKVLTMHYCARQGGLH